MNIHIIALMVGATGYVLLCQSEYTFSPPVSPYWCLFLMATDRLCTAGLPVVPCQHCLLPPPPPLPLIVCTPTTTCTHVWRVQPHVRHAWPCDTAEVECKEFNHSFIIEVIIITDSRYQLELPAGS